MEKQFVPYELSLAMKQLGYNEQCFGFWISKNSYRRFINNSSCNSDLINMFGDEAKQAPSAPLYQQAFDWFREQYDMACFVQRFEGDVFDYEINSDIFTEETDFGDGYFDTYEEARLACLKKLIEIVKHNG